MGASDAYHSSAQSRFSLRVPSWRPNENLTPLLEPSQLGHVLRVFLRQERLYLEEIAAKAQNETDFSIGHPTAQEPRADTLAWLGRSPLWPNKRRLSTST